MFDCGMHMGYNVRVQVRKRVLGLLFRFSPFDPFPSLYVCVMLSNGVGCMHVLI